MAELGLQCGREAAAAIIAGTIFFFLGALLVLSLTNPILGFIASQMVGRVFDYIIMESASCRQEI